MNDVVLPVIGCIWLIKTLEINFVEHLTLISTIPTVNHHNYKFVAVRNYRRFKFIKIRDYCSYE